MKKILFILSIFFVLFSFSPSLYEIYQAKNIPQERYFLLEHNYLFDYNFYLSRIREGTEGRWLVVEKYYNQSHQGSLFQVFYLWLGKLGGIVRLEPPVIYHLARILFGLTFLILIGSYVKRFFKGRWWIISFIFAVTAGSWPILVKTGPSADGFWRFATYMGWWSVVDSLQRITIMPHILFGQIFLLLFIWRFSDKLSKTKIKTIFSKGPAAPFDSLRSLRASASRDKKVYPERNEGHLARVTHSFFCFNSIDSLKSLEILMWGLIGFVVGIVFPPTLIVVYTVFAILTFWEFILLMRSNLYGGSTSIVGWVKEITVARIVFILLSLPSLLYMQLMFRILPWSALALFDVQHRMPLPYKEYFLALGPMLPLGLLGGLVVLGRFIKLGRLEEREKIVMPVIAWIIAVFLLFAIFEKVPTQSPLRFTEGAIHIPLGILAAYFLSSVWRWDRFHKFSRSLEFMKRMAIGIVTTVIILMGLGVMGSMVGWLTDQGFSKGKGTWLVPLGAQLVYPLQDFMEGIYYLRDNTDKNSVVLGYITAGNYIPAYAGNFVYIGHANTPDEDGKEKIAARFFKGEMKEEEAKEFLQRERISYVFFGPQEKEVGGVRDLKGIYPFLFPVYNNKEATVYKILQISN